MKYILWVLVLIALYQFLSLGKNTENTILNLPTKLLQHLTDASKPLIPDPPGYGTTPLGAGKSSGQTPGTAGASVGFGMTPIGQAANGLGGALKTITGGLL